MLQAAKELSRRGLSMPAAGRKDHAEIRGGVLVLPSRGEVVTLEKVQRLMDQEGV